MAKALSATRSPMVGVTTKIGPKSAPAIAARPEPSPKVSVHMSGMLTPIRAATSGSWNEARIATPIRVRLMSR